MIFDVAIGVAATLTMEFLLAHAWLWYERGGSNTVASVETNLSAFKTKTVNLEKRAMADVRGAVGVIESDAKRAEKFFGDWIHPTPAQTTAAQTAPVTQQPVATTPPTMSSGGTPVPSVSL